MINLSEFYQAILHSFENLFEKQDGRQDIIMLINGLENKQPLLPLLEHEKGSLSTLFVPFHSGTNFPYNFPELRAQNLLDPRLIEFCDYAAILEGPLSDYELYDHEPSAEEKEALLENLKHFNSLLPSYEVFKSWLKDKNDLKKSIDRLKKIAIKIDSKKIPLGEEQLKNL